MENASDALKIAFAVFAFIIALSITFYLITSTKEAADNILWHSDNRNYWSHTEGNEQKIVGVDTVIATLKNRGTQSAYVIVKDGSNEYTYKINEQDDKKVNTFIKDNIGKTDKYIETVREIVTDGVYRVGNDGTRISVKPGGSTRTYIIYEKI